MTSGLLLLFGGVLLLIGSLKNEHPWTPVVTAFGGTPPDPPGTNALASAVGGMTGPPAPSPGGPGAPPGPPGDPGSTITPLADAFYKAVFAKFPSATSLGVFACRTIIPHDGGTSSTWSEHAWGNAVDVGGSASVQQAVIVWANINRVRYGINNIIGPGSAVNCVHVDFMPSHAGQTPPCAN